VTRDLAAKAQNFGEKERWNISVRLKKFYLKKKITLN
jgi:hypothetical protein